MGFCYFQKGQYQEALKEFNKALHLSPDNIINNWDLAIVYILLGEQEEAQAAARKVVELDPAFSAERALKRSPIKNQAFLNLVVEATHKAGLK